MSARLSALTRRAGAAAAVCAIGLLALTGPASAHVTVAADDSTKGADDAILTFRVPNEQDAATTTKLDIKFPVKDPIASVKPASIPGWVVTTTTVNFNPPIKTDDGTITQGAGEVSYSAAPGNKGIPVGGFGTFQILVGPLPDTNQVVFSAIQTYSNGQVAAWIQPGHRPSHPTREPDSDPGPARGNQRRHHEHGAGGRGGRPHGCGPVELRDSPTSTPRHQQIRHRRATSTRFAPLAGAGWPLTRRNRSSYVPVVAALVCASAIKVMAAARRRSRACRGHDGVGGEPGDHPDQQAVCEKVRSTGLGCDSEQLDDHVQDRTRCQGQEHHAERFAGEAMPHRGTQERRAAADHPQDEQETPARPGH